jgi:hypothetical protein
MTRLFVVAALAASLAACGSDAQLAPQQYPGAAEQLLARSEVDALTDGSPAHVLLRWWRSSQYAERVGFLGGFATVVSRRLAAEPDLDESIDFFSGSIRVAKPEVTDIDIDGDRATVYALVRFHQPVGSTRFVTNTKPQAFPMVRQRGGWRLADDHFFRAMTAPMRSSRAASD